jgi:translation initiation factor IF-2
MAAEENAELSERRARWSKRGFEVEEEPVQPSSELRERRRSRRSIEREDDEAADEANALREERAARKSARKAARRQAAESAENQPTTLTLPEFISVSQLAQVLGIRYERLLKRLEQEGYDDVFPGKILNMETSGMIAMEYNFEPKFEYDSAVAREEQERDLKPRPELVDKSLLPTRPPVVTIMGHVDHGKTTILDFLRKSSVAAGEAGGITQHIGAFSVPMSSSARTITFLDTPGHAAFLAMRQRGANVTDVVVLVVAADDSVKPQTLESLRCAREAGVPILVAINKVDKDGADVQRVKQDLAKHGVEIEDFGGDVQTVSLSGKTGEGMADFEEAIATLSEILDHRAETDGDVEGWVLEATTKSQGRVATVLVKRGTLRVGQIIVAGKTWARVRSLKNENEQTLNSVGPGMPVEVDGWREQAVAGDQVLQAPNEQKASAVVEYRTEISEREKMSEDMEAINEARRLEQEKRAKEKAAEEAERRGENAPSDETPTALPDQQAQNASTRQITIPFIIKADVSGSAEAVAAYIPSLTSPLIAPEILSSDVGPVNESDIEYASTVQGHIIAFNLPQNNEALGMAESRGVKILENDVIYRTLDQVKEVLEDKLPPIVTQRVLGEAEVAAGFEIGVKGRKKMKIAGCKVRNGVVSMKTRARVLRGGVGGEKVYDGELRAFIRYDRVESCTNCLSRCHYLPEERQERRAGDA